MLSIGWTRVGLLAYCFVATAAAQPPTLEDESPEAADQRRIREFRDRARETAAKYDIGLGENGERKLVLHAVPILQWSNPVGRRKAKGDVFLWTSHGRPEVVLSIYEMLDPDLIYFFEDREFSSLALGPLVAIGPRHEPWQPKQAGVSPGNVPEAPAPLDSRPLRLRQMKLLAERFTADKTTRDGVQRELRRLPQPIYRYAGDHADVVDAALFAFVEGTDPDVLLLLEARHSAEGPRWTYAFARMNSVGLRGYDRGEQVWEAERFDVGAEAGDVYQAFRMTQ
jgi:hypothetical protein